jgi:hypothetical protein
MRKLKINADKTMTRQKYIEWHAMGHIFYHEMAWILVYRGDFAALEKFVTRPRALPNI